MRFENLENNTFQLKVDEAFLEIAKSTDFDYKKLDDEGSWNDFIKQILKDVGIDDDESDYKSAGLSFEINLDKDKGFLRVLLKGQIKKEYQVSSVAFGKYKDEIEPEINREIDSYLSYLKENFDSYLEDLPLTNDDLKKPILDVGAGSGGFISYVREVLGNDSAYAVDITDKNNKDEAIISDGFIIADGFNLPFRDETFDTVISNHYLTLFIKDIKKSIPAITELIRVAKPGGKVILNIHTPDNVRRLIKEEEDYSVEVGSNFEKIRPKYLKKLKGSKQFNEFLEKLKEKYKVEIIEKEESVVSILIIYK